MNKNQVREAELLIRKITLKDLETVFQNQVIYYVSKKVRIWLQEQYAEIDAQLLEIEKARGEK